MYNPSCFLFEIINMGVFNILLRPYRAYRRVDFIRWAAPIANIKHPFSALEEGRVEMGTVPISSSQIPHKMGTITIFIFTDTIKPIIYGIHFYKLTHLSLRILHVQE